MGLTDFQVEGVLGGQSIAPVRNKSPDHRACEFPDQCNGDTTLDNHSRRLEDNRMQPPELFPLSVCSIRREWDQRRVQTYAACAAHLEHALASVGSVPQVAPLPLPIPRYRRPFLSG